MVNVIRITEDELVRVIIDGINDWLIKNRLGRDWTVKEETQYQLFKRGLITEMSLKRKDYKEHVGALAQQLIQNWCLLMYCKLYDKENQNFYHWMGEFSAHAGYIKRPTLKEGSKLNVIKETYIDNFDYNDPQMIESVINDKFKSECISKSCITPISITCANAMNDLVEFLANDKYSTQDYIANTFET